MFDVDLYQRVLGLSDPWKGVDVRLDMESTAIHIHVQYGEGCRWKCPKCEQQFSCYDHAEEWTWRHLNTCQFQTLVPACIPRVKCPEHGVVQVAVPWAEPHGRFTILMERFVIEVLQACKTVKGDCQLLGINWNQDWHVMERAVAWGMARKEAIPAARIGIDEKAFAKGHRYLTIASVIGQGSVEFVTEGQKQASRQRFFDSRAPAQLDGIQAIAHGYVGALRAGHARGGAAGVREDRLRSVPHHAAHDAGGRHGPQAGASGLLQHGDKRLKKMKYSWLSSEENVGDSRRPFFERLQARDPKTARAWAIKENLRNLRSYTTPGWAKRFFDRWRSWAVRSRLAPVVAVARMISRKFDNVISYCRHPITNAVAEGLNSKIMAIKRRAGGFRNIENFKTVIYFHFHYGGLRLYP